MFDELFKFSRVQFAEGEVGFQVGAGGYVVGVLLLLALAGLAVLYARTRGYPSKRAKLVSGTLRGAAVLVLFLPLFEPVLVIPDVVPDENFVAVIVDASESMNIPDGVLGETRFDDARQLLFDPEEGLVPALETVFKLRYYTFGRAAARVDSLPPRPGDDRTDLSAALDRVLADFRGVPLAGVVLLTDGGDNSTGVPLNRAEALRARDVPLHVIGLGREAFDVERELLEATVSKSVEQGTGAEIEVKVRSWGPEPEPVTFSLYRDQTRVLSERRPLKGAGRIDQFALFYEPDAPEAAVYTLQVEPARGEPNGENNALDVLIDPRTDTLRVLHFDNLRRDFKFIKRALEGDQVVAFTSVVRTGTGKLYRQGLRSPEELAGGFPATQAELNTYDVVLVGDVEASFFTPEALRMLERFVRVRGGGFLMLGGRNSFTEGDYDLTPVADLLPVELDPERRQVVPTAFFDPERPVFDPAHPEQRQGFAFVPTATGYESPILKLAPDPATNRARWATMPPMTSLNLLGPVKPGATVLAEKPGDDFGPREPLLVVQRYGKGRTAALPTASTWRWQMLLDAADTRHERFWRQLVRWLAASAAGRVALDPGGDRFVPGDPLSLAVTVVDADYEPVPEATVTAQVTGPAGADLPLAFRPALGEPGTYTATFVPETSGVYEVEVSARQDTTLLGTDTRSVLVAPSRREYYDATLKRGFLESLAEVAGGAYYTPADVRDLPDRLRNRRTSTSIFHTEYLWDMPLVFLLALALLSAEWFYRRRKGLP
ncbi:MAG: membrane protein [Rhodothermaceae bacterium]|nr:MAG: membrane protein [Rhodothermaceae bacterium]